MPSKKLLAIVLAVSILGSTVAYAAAVQPTQSADTQQATLVDEHQAAANQGTSYLRVVHASPDAPAVDVRVENETVLSNVSFAGVSDYLAVPAGTYNVSIVVNGTETAVFDDMVTFDARTATTVAATGEVSEDANTTFEPVLFNDNALTPAENESAVSIVHLSPDAPAVDVTAANGSVVLAENVTFQNASDYVSVPAGNYTVEIRAATATNDGPVVTTVDVSLESGEAYSALALGYLNPDDAPADTRFQVALTEDVTFTVELPGDDEMMDEEMDENETAGNETTTGDDEPTTEDDEPTTEEDETTTEAAESTTAAVVVP
jgi:hypothetical protein